MRLKLFLVLLGASLALFSWGTSWAQQGQVEIVAPPPERGLIPPELVLPGPLPQATHPHEADFRPDNIRTQHDPAFIAPLTTTVQAGPDVAVRIGLSGWTAPPGRGDLQVAREISGWFGFGLTMAWPVQLEPAKPKPAPSRSPTPR